ncbi:MAG: S8 family peptidase [Hyphomicrobiales bacterium]
MSNIAGARASIRACLIATIMCACFGGVGSAQAAGGPEGEATRNPITVYTQDAAAGEPGGLADQLVQRARAQGQIRVIVGLRMKMRMEHTLTSAQAAAQLRDLQALQSGVAARVLGSAGAQSQDRFTFIPFMSIFVNEAQLRRLLADHAVASVQEDVPVPPQLNQSAPLINANDVWAKGFNGTGQVVAVLDTGVAKTHPMFAGKVVSEACYSTTDAPNNFLSVCPGGVAESTAPGSGVNCSTVWKGCDHGTHVAGIAVGNSSVRDGIARDSRLIAMQVFSRLTTTNPDSVRSYTTDQIKALQRVHALRTIHKIAAVNMSLGGGQHAATCDALNPALTTAITNLRNVGIATIIASGNDGFTGFISSPACISTAVAVGNTTKADLVWRSSNHSPLVKLMAPGTNINSALPGGTYGAKTGTSMAAPHVAGAFGVLRNVKTAATVDEILGALTCSGKIVDRRFVTGGDPVELDPQKPRIDLLGAYNHLKKPLNVLRSWPFSAAAELDDWSPLRGQWQLAGGLYVAAPIPVGVGSHVANCNTALTITTRLRRVDAQTNPLGFHWNSGIMFKTTTNFTNETVSGYWVAYNKCRTNASSGSCTGATADKPGQAVFWIINSFNHETGGAASSSLRCQKHVPIAVSGFNTIRVVSNGSSHSYYLNNILVCTVIDATYAAGGVTLDGFFPNPATGHSLAYDFLTIRSIGSNAPAAAGEGDAVMDPAAMAPVAAPANMSVMGSASQ